MMKMRKRTFQIIEIAQENDRPSVCYDIIMIAVIVVSLVPLAFKGTYPVFSLIDNLVGVIFIVDYVLRLWTADLKLQKGKKSFFLYPFTPMAIIDLISILPSFTSIYYGLRLVRLIRGIRLLRVFRTLKIIRYSKSMDIVIDVIKAQKAPPLCSLYPGDRLCDSLCIGHLQCRAGYL